MPEGEPEAASFVADPVDQQPGAPNKESSPVWRRLLKAVVVVLFLLVGSLAASGSPRNGVYYTSTTDFVQSVVVGALIALGLLGLVGAIGRLLARRRGIVRSWSRSATTFPALFVTLAILFLSAVGRSAQHEEALTKATANPNGTLVQREKANLDAHEWSQTRAPVERALNATLRRYPVFLNSFTRNGNTAAVRQIAISTQREYVQEEARWRALSQAPLAGLRRADSEGLSAAALAATAYADYVAGLKANATSGLSMRRDKRALALLDRGDARIKRAGAVLRAFHQELVALNSEYGIR